MVHVDEEVREEDYAIEEIDDCSVVGLLLPHYFGDPLLRLRAASAPVLIGLEFLIHIEGVRTVVGRRTSQFLLLSAAIIH